MGSDKLMKAYKYAGKILDVVITFDRAIGYKILSWLNDNEVLTAGLLSDMLELMEDNNSIRILTLLSNAKKKENTVKARLKAEESLSKGGAEMPSLENMILIIVIVALFGGIIYAFTGRNKTSKPDIKLDNYNDINFKLLNFITNTETDIVLYNRLMKYADNSANEQLASFLRKLASYVAKAKGMDHIIKKNPEILTLKNNITEKINNKLNKYMEKKQKKHEIIKNNMMKLILFVN